MKKRILVYLSGLSLSGGKERVVANLLHEWNKKYHICVITKESKDPFYEVPSEIEHVSLNTPFLKNMYHMNGSRLKRIIASFFNMILSIMLLKRVLKQQRYDYLYVTTPLNAYEAYYAMKEPEKRLVVSEHASIHSYNSVYSKMKRKIYPKAYCISVPNRMDVEEYRLWGCNAVYIPHPITFHVERLEKRRDKIVLNVGRLTPDKQQSRLIHIWNLLDRRIRGDWKLWIVGNGEDEERLKDLIQKNPDESIILKPATRNIAEVYRKASVFAFTSRCEGFGMVLLEAMAFGIPCISFDCPSGPRDIIENEKNGYLVPNGDTEAFKNTLEKLLSLDEAEKNKLIEGAYKTVSEWDTDRIMSLWDEIYR
ncbi:GalNAc-alpha-(1-_4)-GalNAc-alpha-(1-_3)-diNAcBac-PP-undecaprenol alpha-1,4-N-acetyl-D-galactosaminyltransferase [Lachnospiraceae bacterium]|nr:GalNAc-alpha-(1->4)-GalNAc-alpha-(1->3)-diNAcBac-PP-undecaprenol alpha-1,4-N-acetyl-D-galactosaminyltransferase [Lachnospiraceae bacterium]